MFIFHNNMKDAYKELLQILKPMSEDLTRIYYVEIDEKRKNCVNEDISIKIFEKKK